MLLKLLLERNFVGPKQLQTGLCIESLMSDKQHLALFLCFVGVVFILVMVLMMNRKTSIYESPLQTLTPKIKTPVPAGQRQHGSATWLKRQEYKDVFGTYLLDPGDPSIKELMEHGYDDLKFCAKGRTSNEAKIP